MLVKAHRKLLGDGQLSAKEALAKKKAETDEQLDAYRLPDQGELTNRELRLGRPMPYTELVYRVLKLNPSVWVEDSINMPGHAGFYRRKRPQRPNEPDKQFLVAFPKTVLPEFSIIETDERGLPCKEVRGWRTVVLRLAQQGVLTEHQARTFYDTVEHPVAKRWNLELKRLRG